MRTIIEATTGSGTVRVVPKKDGEYNLHQEGKKSLRVKNTADLFYHLAKDDEDILDIEENGRINYLVFLNGLTEAAGFKVNRYVLEKPPGYPARSWIWDECEMFFTTIDSFFEMVFADEDKKKQLITKARAAY